MEPEIDVVLDETVEYHRYTRKILIGDGPVTPIPDKHWSHKGKSFIPDRISLKWDHGQPIHIAQVSGLLLKKNGQPGQTPVTLEYGLPVPGSTSWRTAAPEWVTDLINKGAK